ncbi:coiled-coil domain-containing protein 166 [Rhinoraja longicauda]
MSKKKGRAEAKAKPVGTEEVVLANTTDRIVTLQNEYDEIVTELKQLKLKIYQLRQENEFLEKEAQQTRLETQEYIQQMAKRSEKTQNQIISLSDQNQKQLDEIRKAKEKIMAEFEARKQGLNMTQIEKETELLQINKDIESLNEYKELREMQLARIKELDEQVMVARAQHSQNLHNLKTNFNKEKNDYQHNARRMVKMLEKEANKEAVTCLIQHIEAVKDENLDLRELLVCLIRRSRVLREQQLELEEQQSQVLREREYCSKLRTLRYRKHLDNKPPAITQPDKPSPQERPRTPQRDDTPERPSSQQPSPRVAATAEAPLINVWDSDEEAEDEDEPKASKKAHKGVEDDEEADD